ncbi:MAG TPA: hypothetical protein VHT26_11680 [Trebonia sp.]|jgi:hypothetical protein|nr:hypothetical protein [Trebonia sp.]
MPSGTGSGKDNVERLADIMSSHVLNVLVGIIGIAMPAIAWASHRTATADILLAVETVLVLFLVTGHVWLRRTHIYLRRPASGSMSDPRFFDLVRSRLESDLIADFGEIADGHLLAYAADIPRLLILMLQILTDSPVQPKRALATDLATSPLLYAGREYLAANRRLIEVGGEIRRIFISWEADLVTERYARELHELVDGHRAAGVQCGLAVRDRLSAEQAVDFIAISQAAVGVQDDPPTRGRLSVHFKNVDRWVWRHESIWGHGQLSAVSALTAYEGIVLPMLTSGSWDEGAVRVCLGRLLQH